MTEVYLLRHAQPASGDYDDKDRPLSEKGLSDLPKVTAYFAERHVDVVYSSPFARALKTIEPFAQAYGYPIHIIEDFHEVQIGTDYSMDFVELIHQLWCNPDMHLSDGESYGNVQRRTIAALKPLLDKHKDQTIVIAMHSTAMSRMVNYYNPDFGWEDYLHLLQFTPYVAKLCFDGQRCTDITFHDFN
ncbi:MAG: histidine phosphatase family protein [Clostridiales bacterium]|nr:histidine phosphatase family protein [Clostridiales bacterium]